MKTHKCWPCAFSFTEADSAWDTAIASGCCPNCGLALRDFPAAIKQQHVMPSGIDPAPNVIERRWGIFCVAILMALLTLIGGGKGGAYVFIWGYIAYMAYRGDIDQISVWLKWLIIIHAVGLVVVAGFIGDAWLPGGKGFILVGAGVTLAVKVALYAYVYAIRTKSTSTDHNSDAPVSRQQTTANVTSNDRGSTKVTPATNILKIESLPEELPAINVMQIVEGDKFYEQALIELENGQTVKATWARALAMENGDDAKSKAAYIRLRVAQLKAVYEAEWAAKADAEQKVKTISTLSAQTPERMNSWAAGKIARMLSMAIASAVVLFFLFLGISAITPSPSVGMTPDPTKEVVYEATNIKKYVSYDDFIMQEKAAGKCDDGDIADRWLEIYGHMKPVPAAVSRNKQTTAEIQPTLNLPVTNYRYEDAIRAGLSQKEIIDYMLLKDATGAIAKARIAGCTDNQIFNSLLAAEEKNKSRP